MTIIRLTSREKFTDVRRRRAPETVLSGRGELSTFMSAKLNLNFTGCSFDGELSAVTDWDLLT